MGSPSFGGDAQLYRTVDDQGHVVYTDHPPTLATPKTTVKVHEPSAAELAEVAKRQAATQAADAQRVQQTLVNNGANAAKAQQQHDKQARCDAARNQFYSLKDANRVFQRDAQGNRVYLSDAEADGRRTAAKQAMEAACAP